LIGLQTLFRKEVRRFLKVPGQTLVSPAVTTALYLVVFGFAIGGAIRTVAGVPYIDYMVPGLIMLGVVSASFLNTSSSMFGMKLQGTIIDLLVTPLGPGEIVTAMVGAAVVRGLLVALMIWLVSVAFRGLHVAQPHLALLFPVLAAIGFGAVGLLTGLWADKFEQLNAVPAFVLTPLTFLGGVFYDVRMLPAGLEAVSRANPILYLVEGTRHGFLGHSDGDPLVGLAVLLLVDGLLLGTCVLALRKGWRLRA
jgi:ABC-2 type transport system permease protein